MATRYYSFAEGEFYHVYNRGNSKQLIFKGESDYRRFLAILFLANNAEPFKVRHFKDKDVFSVTQKEPLVRVGAYCLMSNHFHILLTPAVEDGIPKFMLRLATSYAAYFNKRHDRTGSLFEGSYKVKWAESDRYLKYLFAYIHLNPFRDKEGFVRRVIGSEQLKGYGYSSLPDYLGVERNEKKILSTSAFPDYFSIPGNHERELREWLDYYDNVM